MKVCVFGAGALGGHLAAHLIAAKQCEVALVGRGPLLAAIRERGITLQTGGKEIGGKADVATDDPASLPQQDIVFTALKAQMLPAAAEAIGKLVKPDGTVVVLLNGIPWWFHYGLGGDRGNKGTLPLLDPDGGLWKHIRPERVIGAVSYSPNAIIAPGVIKHTLQNRWVFGEPNGSSSARLAQVVKLVADAGIETKATNDIRSELFRKAVGNAPNNTLGALTRLDTAQIASDDGLVKLAVGIINETLAVAAKLGFDLRKEINAEEIVTRARGRPGMRPSTAQDALAGKSLEVDGLLGQTQAFGRELGVPTPVIDTCYALMRGLDTSFRAK
jgi:2-dehydropantoate 2-reductase